MDNVCKAGHFATNRIVTRSPLVCNGGFGQPECRFVEECRKNNGMRVIRRKKKERERRINGKDRCFVCSKR